ncbi:phage tail protein [Vibrio neptunius]|uniref:Phage tail protein n=1 Tax=Vibrio neptunius TaxID=170651 RepID=A0ABS2ZX56_9VIBR|nr:phage tail protein [Vibrio neptunius]MBN3492071.1 phage tail protein [Vibrio neptunius]MBN3514568.1 phage tail protein [Vibrio neptunius]MBN3549306.1 phage tail protein [Vibrio neptunius]MBN3576831.1 phage tail protein [Vibrio neptunius]MCH9870495.1 phage tail protein [Vibrio neptunius]
MSQTAIPLEFERYLQNQISVGDAPDMNEMIFAHIPGLDPSQPINRENGLPDVSLWVHQQDIDQVGKLGDNALAYSVVIPGTVAEFTFNAIYLRDKNVPNSCGMVVHKAEETKENGMASTKSLVQAYDGAAQIAGITVDASTWQIDYQARLKGIEEDHRLACLDNYGHTAFVDGFDVTQQADPNKYKVTPGVVYVGGLRGVLTGEVLQTITTKPNGLYVDVVRQGTALSVWENKVTIAVSETELTDYVDGNGDQHYVAKLAGINADGSVVDWRVKGGLAEHELVSQFMPYSPERVYTTGEICYTRDQATGELSYWQWYSNVESLAGKSPLLSEHRHSGWSDVSKPFYWIPYTGDQVGMPFYWLDTSAPEWAVMEINVDLPIAVYWRLAQRYPALVNGSVINTGEIRSEFLRVLDQGRGVDANRTIGSWQEDQIKSHSHHTSYSNAQGGNGDVKYESGSQFNGANSVKQFLTSSTGGSENLVRNIARPMAIAI